MNYTVLMLKKIDDTTMKRFMGYDWNIKHGGIDINQYDPVYSGNIEALSSAEATLEAIYSLFNISSDPIPGYCGRSLSVSDLVRLEGVGTYFCDSCGWKKLD